MRQINNLIWMWGRPTLTLKQADEMACEFLDKLRNSGKPQ